MRKGISCEEQYLENQQATHPHGGGTTKYRQHKFAQKQLDKKE
jgi:hypothetical protein